MDWQQEKIQQAEELLARAVASVESEADLDWVSRTSDPLKHEPHDNRADLPSDVRLVEPSRLARAAAPWQLGSADEWARDATRLFSEAGKWFSAAGHLERARRSKSLAIWASRLHPDLRTEEVDAIFSIGVDELTRGELSSGKQRKEAYRSAALCFELAGRIALENGDTERGVQLLNSAEFRFCDSDDFESIIENGRRASEHLRKLRRFKEAAEALDHAASYLLLPRDHEHRRIQGLLLRFEALVLLLEAPNGQIEAAQRGVEAADLALHEPGWHRSRLRPQVASLCVELLRGGEKSAIASAEHELAAQCRERARLMSGRLMSVFLSYGSPDLEFATRLKDALTVAGANVWFAPRHAVAGQTVPKAISEGVERQERMILISSSESLTRDYVQLEIGTALAREAQSKSVPVLIPVLLDDQLIKGNWAPSGVDWESVLSERVAVDFRGARDDPSAFDESFMRLLQVLVADSPEPS